MLSNLIQTFYNLADSYFVSRMEMSGLALNSIGVVWPIVFSIIGLGGGLSRGAVALISKHVGADNKEEAKLASAQIISYLFILGVIMGIVGYLISPSILKLMQVTGITYDYALQYLNVIFWGVPFMYLFFAFQSIEQAQGNMALPMIFSVIILDGSLDFISLSASIIDPPVATIGSTKSIVLSLQSGSLS